MAILSHGVLQQHRQENIRKVVLLKKEAEAYHPTWSPHLNDLAARMLHIIHNCHPVDGAGEHQSDNTSEWFFSNIATIERIDACMMIAGETYTLDEACQHLFSKELYELMLHQDKFTFGKSDTCRVTSIQMPQLRRMIQSDDAILGTRPQVVQRVLEVPVQSKEEIETSSGGRRQKFAPNPEQDVRAGTIVEAEITVNGVCQSASLRFEDGKPYLTIQGVKKELPFNLAKTVLCPSCFPVKLVTEALRKHTKWHASPMQRAIVESICGKKPKLQAYKDMLVALVGDKFRVSDHGTFSCKAEDCNRWKQETVGSSNYLDHTLKSKLYPEMTAFGIDTAAVSGCALHLLQTKSKEWLRTTGELFFGVDKKDKKAKQKAGLDKEAKASKKAEATVGTAQADGAITASDMDSEGGTESDMDSDRDSEGGTESDMDTEGGEDDDEDALSLNSESYQYCRKAYEKTDDELSKDQLEARKRLLAVGSLSELDLKSDLKADIDLKSASPNVTLWMKLNGAQRNDAETLQYTPDEWNKFCVSKLADGLTQYMKVFNNGIADGLQCVEALHETPRKKTDIFKAVSGEVYEPGFKESLDQNEYLLGFLDCVYDLKAGSFRSRTPDDRVSKSAPHTSQNVQRYMERCGVNDNDRKMKNKLIDILQKVYPQKNENGIHEVYEFALTDNWTKCLCGDQSMCKDGHKFVQHTGRTRNGKSFLIKLLLFTFGDTDDSTVSGYFASPSMSLCYAEDKANAPMSDLFELNHARVVAFDETAAPGSGKKIQVELLKKRTGNAAKTKAAKKQKEPELIHMAAAGFHFFGQHALELECDPALEERMRTFKYEGYFASSDAKRMAAMQGGMPHEYIFEADSSIDKKETLVEMAPVFMAMLIERWERYYNGVGDDVATWPGATPAGEFPPVPAQVEEWDQIVKVCNNPLTEMFESGDIVLCGSKRARELDNPCDRCDGWTEKGEWTCKHFLRWTSDVQKCLRLGKGDNEKMAMKDVEAASGRYVIEKLSQSVANRVAKGSRLNKVFPAMRFVESLHGNQKQFVDEHQFEDDKALSNATFKPHVLVNNSMTPSPAIGSSGCDRHISVVPPVVKPPAFPSACPAKQQQSLLVAARSAKKQKKLVEEQEVDKEDAKQKNPAEEDDGETTCFLWEHARDTAVDHFVKSLVLWPLEELRQRVSLEYLREEGGISTETYNLTSQGVWRMLHEMVKFIEKELSKSRADPDEDEEGDEISPGLSADALFEDDFTKHYKKVQDDYELDNLDDRASFKKIFVALSRIMNR